MDPEQVARMYHPGVVPLRPLNLGDIFGGAVSTIRRNPEATIGMAVVVLGAFLVPSLLLSLGAQFIPRLGLEGAGIIGLLVPSVVSFFATLVLSGLILYVVSEAALGDKVGLGQTWRAVRGRILALIGVTVLTTLLLLLVVGVGGALLALGIGLGGNVGVILGIVAFVASIVAAFWLAVRLILATAPVVLERAGPIRGIARSWALSTGSQFWRLLGITLLAQLLAGIFGAIVSTPIQLLLTAVGGTVIEDESYFLTLTVFSQHFSQFVVGLIVTPFTAGVTALLYLDQRIRREGLDITMQQAASTRAARRSRP